mgnify:CR=1 FL=1
MIDIPNYEGLYKFDNELNQVYSIKKNMYLKNCLKKNSIQITLYKNGKRKTYTIHNLVYICNPIENNNLVDIPNYNDYKFDTQLEQVYNTDTNKYLKNHLTNSGYYQVGLFKNKIRTVFGIHQLVYIINNPTEDITGFDIDHIDNNKLNNKIENLRKATVSDNQSNTKTRITNILGIKYISKTICNTYRFKLVKNGIIYQKIFKTIEEAIEHRDRVVLEKCGEFANLG